MASGPTRAAPPGRGTRTRRWLATQRYGNHRARAYINIMKMDFPSHVPEIVIAKLLSVNRRTVAKLVTKGILRKTARGFDTIESIAAHLAYQISLVAKKHGEGDYGRARSALMLEKARMARLQREKMEGSAIDSAEVEARWTTTIAATKSKFVGMPSK